MLLEFFISSVYFCNLFNYNMLNVRIMKLQGYMKVIFEASPTILSYAELTTNGSLLPFLILLK